MRLEKTSQDHVVQPPCLEQGQLKQVAWDHVQLDSECGWRLHSLSVQYSFCTVRQMKYQYSQMSKNFPIVIRVVTNLFKLLAQW